MRLKFIYLLACVACLPATVNAQNKMIDLQGEWRFEIDAEDAGVKEGWFMRKLNDKIILPGSMAENRKGNDVTLGTQWTASIYDSSFFYNPRLERFRQPDNLKLPFWLTPAKYYVGAAWYQKDVFVPKTWKNDRILLFLERPHTESRVWVNGKEAGMQNSLCVPHVFDISPYLKTGNNVITVCVDNRTKAIDVGKDSHSITDQTQGNWNGIVGRIELRSTPETYIDDVQVFPNIKDKTVKVKVALAGKNTENELSILFNIDKVKPDNLYAKIQKDGLQLPKTVEYTLPMGEDVLLWDEFHPNLYKLKVTLYTKQGEDTKELQFGMREFTIQDTYFYVNGQKTFLRGTVENCVFPLTGYAPMDEESWERVFRICRSFGLNHMRFHSFCPPEAAFIAADKVGFYLQPEGPTWPNHGSSLGDGRPVDDYLWQEARRIVKEYGNSPSFAMFAIGNEPRGRWVAWVSKFVDYWKTADARRVYTGASVGGSWAWQPHNQYHVKAGARGLNWKDRPESLSDFLEKIDTVKQPYVSHETGQWCVFPDFSEIRKYTGVMRARNFELFREDLASRGMSDMETEFLMASGKLQALCYKHEIEKTLRTPKYAGFQLLGLNDYSGQGTALVGVLNAFWEEKGYIGAEEFRQFCSPTVLLSRMEKFVYTSSENLSAKIEVAHYGENPIKQAVVRWKIRDAYKAVVAEGTLLPQDVLIGNCQNLGTVTFPLKQITKATKLNLEVSFDCMEVRNNWDFWVYPSVLPEVSAENILITDKIDAETEDMLAKGGNVLLLLAGKVEQGKDVVQYMTPAFWNTSWFKMRPPHTVGTLVNSFHPIFNDFPTDYYTGLQWWELVDRGQIMEITNFPAGFRPIVQPIDTWFINRKLATLFEANAGKGKIVVTSIDLTTGLDNRPVARQLYFSILKYMQSHRFIPENSVSLSCIKDILLKEGERLNVHTQDAPDELKGK